VPAASVRPHFQIDTPSLLLQPHQRLYRFGLELRLRDGSSARGGDRSPPDRLVEGGAPVPPVRTQLDPCAADLATEMRWITKPGIQPHGSGLLGQREGSRARERVPVVLQRRESPASAQHHSAQENDYERYTDDRRNEVALGKGLHRRRLGEKQPVYTVVGTVRPVEAVVHSRPMHGVFLSSRVATLVGVVLLTSMALAGCTGRRPARGADGGMVRVDGGGVDAGAVDGAATDTGGSADETGPFALTSSAFVEGETIPVRFECGPPVADGPGDNVSPQLTWTPGPPETLSYALVMRDIDAGGFVHWVLYDIPASVRDVAENVPEGYEPAFPAGARQAELQMSGYYGYLGPCSPGRVNTYQITLHALDTAALPGVDATTTENALAAAVEAASIASASLSGES